MGWPEDNTDWSTSTNNDEPDHETQETEKKLYYTVISKRNQKERGLRGNGNKAVSMEDDTKLVSECRRQMSAGEAHTPGYEDERNQLRKRWHTAAKDRPLGLKTVS